jgi:hypothetical protein
MGVCVRGVGGVGGKAAETKNSLVTYSININGAWGFTFILICVWVVVLKQTTINYFFYSVFVIYNKDGVIIYNYFSAETLQFKLKKIPL